MLNSYRLALFLMIVFGAIGIQAARYQVEDPAVACERTLPDLDKTADGATEHIGSGNAQPSDRPLDGITQARVSKVAVNVSSAK